MAHPPSNADAISHMNGQNFDEERGHTRNPSFGLSDHDGEENEDDDNAGDYSSRMEELFEEDDDEEAHEDDEDEGFVYTGMDADNSAGDYRSQLRDVLGPELEEEYTEELEVERSLLHDENEKVAFSTDNPQVCVWRAATVLQDLLS
jgi:vacuolar protein sorting-associated protein 8